METSPSSLSYLRAVQQLQKKTDELERVFDEARRLEREKTVLVEENAALRQTVTQLEAQNRDWRAEFGVLEQQVKKQQQHLQEHIEREAARLQQSGTEARESVAARESLLHRLKIAEEAEEKSAAATARCRKLSDEVAQLKRELKTERTRAAHYRTSCMRAEANIAVLDQIERKALQGVKSELTSFSAENERLISDLEAEKKARRVVEEKVESLQQLLQRQREVNERQQLLAKQELQALSMQNDTLMEDFKQLMTKCEESSSYGVNGCEYRSRSSAPNHPCRGFTVDRSTQTTEVVFTRTPLPPLNHAAIAPQEALTVAATPVTLKNTLSCNNVCCSKEQLSTLLLRVRELERETAEQALIIQKKMENERLLEERAALLEGERSHLQTKLSHQEMSGNKVDQRDKDNILRAVADTELSAVLEAVIDILQLLVQSTGRLRSRLFIHSAPSESTVLPVVPCREYNSPHLNAIFSHLGGMRHVAYVIDEIGLKKSTELRQLQELQSPQQAQENTTSPKMSLCHKPSPTSQSPKPRSLQPSPSAATTVRDINSWLATRRNHLQQQLNHSQQTNADDTNPISQQHHTTKYKTGETLLDAANALHKTYRIYSTTI